MLDNFTENTTTAFFAVNATTSDDVINNVTNNAEQINDGVKYIGYVTVPIFFIVGLLGNALTLAIMTSTHFRSSTTSVYLSALSMSDTVYIIVSPFTKQFINELIQTDVRALSRAGCKAYFFFFRTAKICSSWFVVAICIERFLVIWFPLHAKMISTKRSAIFAVSSLTIAIVTFDGVWTMVDDIVTMSSTIDQTSSNDVKRVCIPNAAKPGMESLSAAFVVAGTVIFSIIPMIILLIFTPLTIFKLFRHRSIRRSMTTTRGDRDTVHVTRTMLCVMGAYIFLVTPISVAHSVAFFNGDSIFESKDPDFIYFREFAQMLEGLNYSVNFFLYVVSNETFRQKLFKLLGCCSKRRHVTVVMSSSVSSTPASASLNPTLSSVVG